MTTRHRGRKEGSSPPASQDVEDNASSVTGLRTRYERTKRLALLSKTMSVTNQQLHRRGPAAASLADPVESERRQLVEALAGTLASLGVNAPATGNFSQQIAAMCAAFERETASRKTAEEERAGADAARSALQALVATQREELHGLRQQIDNMNEAWRQQGSRANQQLTELNERYRALYATHHEFRVQADTIYAAFEHLRSAGLTGIWRVFGAALRDQELYDAVVLILTSGLFDEPYFRQQCRAGEIPRGLSPVVYYLRHGDRLARDPHPLFNIQHYRTQLPTERRGSNALIDYLQYGHGLAPHPLFMPSYYLEQLPGLANITGVAPLMHYCIAGPASGANPHPLFDNAYYEKQLEVAGVESPTNLLSFYLSGKTNASPHPLFDRPFYQSRYLQGQGGIDPLVHFLTVGDRQGANPHAYFHTRYYRLANPDLAQDEIPALVHFILKGAGEDRAPHPMFDLAYYKRANPGIAETGYRLLVHFVTEGEAKAANPHPLIDLAYVRRQLAERGIDDGLPFRALLDPANIDWLAPHPLFDVEFYRSRSPAAASYAGGAFLYYLLAGHKLDEPTHPLFDPAFYRAQAEAQGVELADPLVHFLTSDAGLNPHPLFDIDYYLRAGPPIDGSPLLHYLIRGDKRGRDPHPLFDVAFYKRRAGIEDEPALVHYLSDGSGDPHPLFDTEHYLAALPTKLPSGVAPLVHYLAGEDGDAADPHPLFDQPHYWSQVAEDERWGGPALLHYLSLGSAAPSPHPLFDLDFFGAAHSGSYTALVGFLRQFQTSDASRSLHRLEWREANREFCGLSYRLDHPELPAEEVPILHFLRGQEGQVRLSDRADGLLPAVVDRHQLQRAPVDFQRLIDCARERERRGVLSGGRLPRDDYGLVGDRLADAEIWWSAAADPVERIAGVGKLALYATEPGPGGLQLYHRQMIGALRDAGYATVVVGGLADENIVSAADIDLWVLHSGNDFHAWAGALAHLAQAVAGADHLLLVNDKIVGPIGGLKRLLRRMERDPAEILGLTEIVEGECLQADFLLVSGDALVSGALPRLLSAGIETAGVRIGASGDRITCAANSVGIAETWLRTVPDQIAWARAMPERLAELGLAEHLPKSVARRYADYLENWLVDRSGRVSQGEAFDPRHVFWDAMIDRGLPFLSKELLLINPMQVPTLIRLGEVCARYGDEGLHAALCSLAHTKSDFPRSYLRLSRMLVDAMAKVTA
jgi:hypothetical protein